MGHREQHHIQEAHPLKQGLKLRNAETDMQEHDDSRGTSTKTRIETQNSATEYITTGTIQEAHPLKQGLKHAVVPARLSV